MRDGWCRDCESSEYKKECMEETKHTPDLMTDWYLREDSLGEKSMIYKRTGPNEITLLAQCYNEKLATLMIQAPDLLAKVSEQQKELASLRSELEERRQGNRDLIDLIALHKKANDELRAERQELEEALRFRIDTINRNFNESTEVPFLQILLDKLNPQV